MLLMILMVKKLLEPFTKKRITKNKSVQKNEFRIEQVIKRKGDKLYVKWKGTITHLIVGQIKMAWYK